MLNLSNSFSIDQMHLEVINDKQGRSIKKRRRLLSRLSIRVKLTIALLCCAVFTPLALVAYTTITEEKTLLERKRLDVRKSLQDKGMFISNFLDIAAMDVRFLSKVPAIRIFSSTNFDNHSRSRTRNFLDQFARINSNEVFVDFMLAKPNYQRISFLDMKGREQLRIDREQGNIHVFDKDQLQNKAENEGFLSTDKMKEGDVYIIDVDLEKREIAQAVNPVLRLATIVFDKENIARGILFFNISGQMILDILEGNSFRGGSLILVDGQGNYLAQHDLQKSGRKISGSNATIKNEFPGLEKLSERMTAAENQYFQSQGNEVFVSIISGDFIQRARWFLVEVIPTSVLAGSNRPYLIIVLLISVIGVLFSLILGYTISKYWLLNPIKDLTSMAEKISRGEFPDLSTGRQSDDEIGTLCSTFNQMSKALAIVEQERTGHVIALNEEIADRKQNESDLVLHRTFFEQSSDAMFITDNQARITNVNKAFTDMTGYTLEEAIGKQPGMLNSDKYDPEFYQGIWDSLDRTGTWQGEIWDRRKGKEMFPSLHTLNTIKNVNGEMHYVSVFKDISQLKEAENDLWRIAHFDSLTGLANRKLLEERINEAIITAQNTGQHGAVLFLDLDNFKHINDSLGHNYGDLLLKEISSRLVSVFRAEDTVARLGGDEYVILIKELPGIFENAMLQTKQIIEKLFNSLHKPCFIDNCKLHISASMGVVLFPNGGDEELFPEGGVKSGTLLKQADLAMYAAKNNGKNTYCFFHSDMQDVADRRLQLERDLRQALSNDELVLYYQPQVNRENELLGYEALLRWENPELGLVLPGEFITVAEESDLILEIGEKVLLDACKQLVDWQKNGHDVPRMSVNISPRQFAHPKFTGQVHSVIEKTGVNPKQLVFEVTESLIINNVQNTISNMHLLKQAGIIFCIDDFGTGYSSLEDLNRLPIDELKIDCSFIRDLEINQNHAVIVDTIVAMANNLNLELTAEGVETEEQMDYLVNRGCKRFQGYYFSGLNFWLPVNSNETDSAEDELKFV